jgi:hypothetical protein
MRRTSSRIFARSRFGHLVVIGVCYLFNEYVLWRLTVTMAYDTNTFAMEEIEQTRKIKKE